jgi:hypothetical protein
MNLVLTSYAVLVATIILWPVAWELRDHWKAGKARREFKRLDAKHERHKREIERIKAAKESIQRRMFLRKN